jgi:hypothetical protein
MKHIFYTHWLWSLLLLLFMPVRGECQEVYNDILPATAPVITQVPKPADSEPANVSTIKFSLSYSSQTEQEYLPSIEHNLFTWHEVNREATLSYQWGWRQAISGGWQHSTIKQKNDLLGDVDFSLIRQGPYIQAALPLYGQWMMQARIADEEFTNNDGNAYYQLTGTDSIVTGYLVAGYASEKYWIDISYDRQRDPEPDYDPLLNRAKLDIKIKELSGVSVGHIVSPEWSVSSSLYYEQYETVIEDQFNINGLVSYTPQQLKTVDFSLGAGYYSEEKETIVNLSVGYLWQWDQLDGNINYQLEYSENDQAWLNQAGCQLNWMINKNVSLSARSLYGKEFGDDQDTIFSFEAGVNFALF